MKEGMGDNKKMIGIKRIEKIKEIGRIRDMGLLMLGMFWLTKLSFMGGVCG